MRIPVDSIANIGSSTSGCLGRKMCWLILTLLVWVELRLPSTIEERNAAGVEVRQ